MRKTKGFTLIELLVVVSILGILMAVLIPRVFSTRETSYSFACRANLKKIFGMFNQYRSRHNDMWPNESGVRFLLVLTQDPQLFEGTKDDVNIFFCPSARRSDMYYAKIIEDPYSWMQDLDEATSRDSSYAGRDMEHYHKNLDSNLEVIVCDDNEGGSNHKGSLNILCGGGRIEEILYSDLVKKGIIQKGVENVPVGPESPVKMKGCDLTKVRVD